MATIISVLSPHRHNTGNTVATIFAALGLGATKKKVLLAHTAPMVTSLCSYLGLELYEDKTTTPVQLVKLLREGAIQASDIEDYCKNVMDSIYVFANNKKNFTEEDMTDFVHYVIDNLEFDYIIFDISSINSELSKYVLLKSQIVLINMTNSKEEIDTFTEALGDLKQYMQNKSVLLLCNKYSKLTGNIDGLQKRLRLLNKIPLIIHYNPYIVKCCNEGTLLMLYKNYICAKQAGMVELNKDISRLAMSIQKAAIASRRAGYDAKKSKLN